MMRVISRLLFVLALVGSAPAAATVHRIVLDGAIDPVHAEYLVRAMDQAEHEGSTLILLEVNTPGGMMDSMEEILQRMLKSRVPVCVYVTPPGGRAASAGFFLLVSADVAAMSPGTRTGAAHPIMAIGGMFPLPDTPEPKAPAPAPQGPATATDDGKTGAPAPDKATAPKPAPQESILMSKIREDAEAYLRSIAERRGRDVKAAQAAVSDSTSYTDQEALALRLVDLVAANEGALLAQLDGREVHLLDGTAITLATRDVPIVGIEMTFRERALTR